MYALITFLTPGMPKDEAETLVAKEISDCYAPYTVDITWNPLSLLDVAEYSSTIGRRTQKMLSFRHWQSKYKKVLRQLLVMM